MAMKIKLQNMECQVCGLVPFLRRSRLVGFGCLMLGCCALLMAQTAQDFTKIYDSYLATVKTGNYDKTAALLSTEVRGQLKTADDRDTYMAMMKLMTPMHYETTSLTMSDDKQKAEVEVLATLAVPETMQKEQKLPPTQRAEISLSFVKEAGQWKMGSVMMIGDPDKRARPKDLNMGSRGDYKEDANSEVGGSILRMEKQAAGTVFVLRVTDEEIAVFVPAAKVSDEFVAGRILVVHGAENKSDKLKLWADDAKLYKEPASN
jgi:hypothetical protein